MFLDCERRYFVVQVYHQDLLDYWPRGDNTHVDPHSPPVILKLDNNRNKTTSALG
ncbi:hypothetical protein CASFOL_031564 [Castilleja foliolosa]|uniref:Uncharacterized protein n=1 Tax=Castilleja foliolosa TaxID=1961234 RepID=A0ABD3C6Z5_9LAMI